MEKGDQYRLFIIISYVALVICVLLLLAGLWNRLSLNPNVQIGNGLYLLVILILLLSTVVFILHIMEERQVLHPPEQEEEIAADEESAEAEEKPEKHSAPFDVEIDSIAGKIVPRLDTKESLEDYAERILVNLAKEFQVVQGIFYLKNQKTNEFESLCTYAYTSEKEPVAFKPGDGLTGQVAKNHKLMIIRSVPPGYLEVQSGLGKSSPDNLLIIPLLLNKETIGIIELASFLEIDRKAEWIFRNLAKIIGNSIVTKIKSARKK